MKRRLESSIQGTQVLLRQWAEPDTDFYATYLGDEAFAQYHGGMLDRQQAWRHLASVIGHWSLRGFGPYAVVDRLSQQLRGCAGVWEPDGWPCREFVFWFTAEAYQSTCALSAAQMVLDALRSSFNDSVITSFVHPSNRPALASAVKLGGTLHENKPLFDFGPHIRVSYAGALPPIRS